MHEEDDTESRDKDEDGVPNIMRYTLSDMEKILNKMIERVDGMVEKEKVSLDQDIELHSLRQKMRTLRRWRNGSCPYSHETLDEFSLFLYQSRRKLIQIELDKLRDKLLQIDEYSLILDENCSNLRQDVEEDIIPIETLFRKRKNNSISEIHICEIEVKLSEVNDTVNFLLTIIQDITNPQTVKHSRLYLQDAKNSKITFEINSHRNVVLSIADRIRKMIKLFKEGAHIEEDVKCQGQACAEVDIEALRRQLRKIRRWQGDVTEFNIDDVRDLELIVSAIKKHISPGADTRCFGRGMNRQDSTYGTMRGDKDTLSDSNPVSPPSDCSAPPAYEDVMGQSFNQDHSKDSLEENSQFGERLI